MFPNTIEKVGNKICNSLQKQKISWKLNYFFSNVSPGDHGTCNIGFKKKKIQNTRFRIGQNSSISNAQQLQNPKNFVIFQ